VSSLRLVAMRNQTLIPYFLAYSGRNPGNINILSIGRI